MDEIGCSLREVQALLPSSDEEDGFFDADAVEIPAAPALSAPPLDLALSLVSPSPGSDLPSPRAEVVCPPGRKRDRDVSAYPADGQVKRACVAPPPCRDGAPPPLFTCPDGIVGDATRPVVVPAGSSQLVPAPTAPHGVRAPAAAPQPVARPPECSGGGVGVFHGCVVGVLVGGRALGKVRAKVISDLVKRHGGRAWVVGSSAPPAGITHVVAVCTEERVLAQQWAAAVPAQPCVPYGVLVVPPEWVAECVAQNAQGTQSTSLTPSQRGTPWGGGDGSAAWEAPLSTPSPTPAQPTPRLCSGSGCPAPPIASVSAALDLAHTRLTPAPPVDGSQGSRQVLPPPPPPQRPSPPAAPTVQVHPPPAAMAAPRVERSVLPSMPSSILPDAVAVAAGGGGGVEQFPWHRAGDSDAARRDALLFGTAAPAEKIFSGVVVRSETGERGGAWGPAPRRYAEDEGGSGGGHRGPRLVNTDVQREAAPAAVGRGSSFDKGLLKSGFIGAFFGDCGEDGRADRDAEEACATAAEFKPVADDVRLLDTAADHALPTAGQVPLVLKGVASHLTRLFSDDGSAAQRPKVPGPLQREAALALLPAAEDRTPPRQGADAAIDSAADGRLEWSPRKAVPPIQKEPSDELGAFFASAARTRDTTTPPPPRAGSEEYDAHTKGPAALPSASVSAAPWATGVVEAGGARHAVRDGGEDPDALHLTTPTVGVYKPAPYFACVKGKSGVAAEAAAKGPGPNEQLVAELDRLQQIYASTGDHWRKYAYSRAVAVVKRWRSKITCKEEIAAAPGIGAKMAEKIQEILDTGACAKRQLLESSEEVTVARVFGKIWGVGPATISKLYCMQIRTLAALRAKREAVLNSSQLIGLRYYEELQERIPRAEVAEAERYVTAAAEQVDPSLRLQVCGSYRRGKDTCGDIDVLICHKATRDPMDLHTALNAISAILTRQGFLTDRLVGRHTEGKAAKKDSESHASYMGICQVPACKDPLSCPFTHLSDIAIEDGESSSARASPSSHVHRRIDMKVYDERHYAFAVLYFTGSDYFNRSMRLYAQKRGMSLSDRSLVPVVRVSKEKVHEGDPVPCSTEEEIFAALGLQYKSPAERDV